MSKQEIYNNWYQPESVERFAKKDVSEFFRSETHFLEEIGVELKSVLDIGCASGRFIDLVETYSKVFSYTGIDLVPESIDIGRELYPQAEFHVASALEFETEQHFNLVNATGVFQHEPEYAALLQRMINWSDKYVLFDVKVSSSDQHLIDINEAYCQRNDDRMYFNILSWQKFKEELLKLDGIEQVRVYGYETRPNKVTVVPEYVLPYASMGVLLMKGGGSIQLHEDSLPDFLGAG